MTEPALALAPTPLLRVMFIDAGPTRSAWVVIEVRSDGSVVPVQGGWHAMRDAWLWGVMDAVWATGGVVALEYISGALYDPKRWYDLCETLRVEGDIRRTAEMRGAEHALLPFVQMRARQATHPRTLFCVPASSWRQELLQRKSPKDAEIEVVVVYLCGRLVEVKGGHVRMIDLPAARDSAAYEHIIDALGGALVVASTMLGARFKIPDDVRASQIAAREKARRRQGVRRTLEQLGADPAAARFANGDPVFGPGGAGGEGTRKPARATRKARRVTGANTRTLNARRKGP